jgi:hypothetical protein
MTVHLVHPIGGGHSQGVQQHHHSRHILAGPSEGQVRWHLMIEGGGDGLGPSSGLHEVDACSSLHLKCSLVVV